MDNEKRLMFLASEVMISEEDKLDPVFLKIKLKLADSEGNRNNEGITASFISDLINRKEEFNGLPFYADVKKLIARKYDELGHMYNRVTKRFGTTQIGSLVDFYSEADNDGVVSLYATARVPKRENEICIRLVELYELGKLCVSFEVRYNPEYTTEKGGVLFIDANEDNAMTGIAVVSVPACVDAVALDMVAEVADDSDDIVAECEEQTSERGETEKMPKDEELVMEAEKVGLTETEETQPEDATAIAEGEGASESAGEGASESGGEGASESGSGAGASDGAGASEGGSVDSEESGDSGDDAALTVDHDEKKANAEAEEANAEVLEHTVQTEESIENYGGNPIHVIQYHERIIETMDDAGALIAELDTKIAELEEIKVKYDAIIAEQEKRELAEKRANAKAFAEKQGLNTEDSAVAEAIEKLDYTKIAELSMAEDKSAEEETSTVQTITLASFVEMEVGNDTYGGLLNRRTK